ncbi:MAG: hypothetical protein ACTH29_00735 [Fusobacterium sp.]
MCKFWNYFRIDDIKGKEQEFLEILEKLEHKKETIKYLLMDEFKLKGLNPEKIKIVKTLEEYQKPIDLVKEENIFEISKDKDKVFLINDGNIYSCLEQWKKSQNKSLGN